MQYAFLCYHNEKEVFAWSKEQTDRVMDVLATVFANLGGSREFRPVLLFRPN